MSCYQNGQIIGYGGLTMILDEEDTEQTTTAAAYTQVPNSQLIIPAGNWLVHFSIECRISVTTTIGDIRLYDTVGASEIGYISASYIGYRLYGGVKNVVSASTLQWQFYRSAGGGTVYVRRARIIAVSA